MSRRTNMIGFGFTLVELLVVIGVISLLIALLLPTLNRAREAANSLACLSNLRQIGAAARLHETERRGFFPLAGEVSVSPLSPAALGDSQRQRYVYLTDGGNERPAPMPAALSRYLGQTVRLDSPTNMVTDLNNSGILRLFKCPSQQGALPGRFIQSFSNGWLAPTLPSSYIQNEALLGFNSDPTRRLRGQLNRVRNSSKVMFVSDGLPRGAPFAQPLLIVWNSGAGDRTLLDARNNSGGGHFTVFDFTRHRGKMNVAFADGHAESVRMTPSGLSEVFIFATR